MGCFPTKTTKTTKNYCLKVTYGFIWYYSKYFFVIFVVFVGIQTETGSAQRICRFWLFLQYGNNNYNTGDAYCRGHQGDQKADGAGGI